MKTFFSDLIPKIKQFSEKLDNMTLLTNQHWVVITELTSSKNVFIFRSNGDLLISKNGKIEKGKWEYLGNNSLLIEMTVEMYLYKHGFFDENILALKVDGKDEYAFFFNENKFGGDLNSIEEVLSFLENKYLKMMPTNQINQPDVKLDANQNYPVLKSDIGIEYITIYSEFDIIVSLYPRRNKKFKYGFVNNDEILILPYKYDKANSYKEGLALVYDTKDGIDYYGFIDPSGNEVIPLIYEFAENFSYGLALVRKNRKFGFINKKGIVKIPIEFESADSFKRNKLAYVKDGERRFSINRDGEIYSGDPEEII